MRTGGTRDTLPSVLRDQNVRSRRQGQVNAKGGMSSSVTAEVDRLEEMVVAQAAEIGRLQHRLECVEQWIRCQPPPPDAQWHPMPPGVSVPLPPSEQPDPPWMP